MRGETAAACRLRVSARKDGRNLWLFVKNAEHRSPKTAPSAQLAVRPVAAQAQPTRTPEQPAAQPQAPEQQPQPPVYPQQPVYQQPVYPPQPAYDPADHTAEFDPEDVSQNKVIAMAAYILGTVGIIIALLAAPQSKYAAFHSRQALKLDIVSTCCSSFPLCLLSRSLCRLPARLHCNSLRRAHHLLLPGMQRQSKGRCHHR